MALSLTLGTITFSNLELPETIGPLGGKQEMASHDFPGGIRTIQTYGAFPEVIKWNGVLTGALAFTRSLEIDRMRATAQSITLFYGVYGYIGTIAHFHPRPKHQWFIPYEIEFLPSQDLSGSILTLLAETGLAPEIALAQQLGLLNNPTLTAPIGMQGPIQSLATLTASALISSNGKVSAISPTNAGLIMAGVGAVVSSAAPYLSSFPSAATSLLTGL